MSISESPPPTSCTQHACIIPNSHFASFSKAADPLEVQRSCHLALECWNLRGDINETILKNRELRKYIRRLRTALERANNTVSHNRSIIASLQSDLNQTQNELTSRNAAFQELQAQHAFDKQLLRKCKNMHCTVGKQQNPEKNDGNNLKSNYIQQERDSLKTKLELSRKQNQTLSQRLLLAERKNKELLSINEYLNHQVEEFKVNEMTQMSLYEELEQAYEELHTKFEIAWNDKLRAERQGL